MINHSIYEISSLKLLSWLRSHLYTVVYLTILMTLQYRPRHLEVAQHEDKFKTVDASNQPPGHIFLDGSKPILKWKKVKSFQISIEIKGRAVFVHWPTQRTKQTEAKKI